MFDPQSPYQPGLPGMATGLGMGMGMGMGLGVSSNDPPFVPQHLARSGGKPSHYLLFFALLPPTTAAEQIAQCADQLRGRHGLWQRPMATARLHVTVQPVVAFAEGIPRLIVQAAMRAAAGIAAGCRPVPITFARAGSMGPVAPTVLALHCDPGSRQAISALRAGLVLALHRHGFGVAPHRAPHMSLVYGTDHVAAHDIEPIHWTATRLVLILSHHGLGHHEVVEQWPLWQTDR